MVDETYGYFILVVMDEYLGSVLDGLVVDGIEVQSLKRKVKEAKEQWIMKQDRWQLNEFYLGLQPFHDELRHCVDEFKNELKRTLGFSPHQYCFVNV